MSVTKPDNEKLSPSKAGYRISSISPHNKAIYEAGKKMLVDSIDVGREFCKSMITVSTGAIPVYIALLKVVGVESTSRFSNTLNVLFILPCMFFLSGTVVYIIGYFPRAGIFSLDVVEEVNDARKRLILRRRRMIVLATCLFVIGMFIAIIMLTLEALIITRT